MQKLLLEHTKAKLAQMGVININDIVCEDCRIRKFGNVIFTHNMEDDRKIVLDYLDSLGIISCGRFGEWDYLWSDQSFLSGKNASDKI